METYNKYKDIGTEWIGEIPEHWDKKRFKYCFDLVSEKSEENLPKIGLENIEGWTGKYIKTNSEFEGDGGVFKINDILYGKLRPYLAKVYLAEFEGKAVGDIFIFRCKDDLQPKFGSNLILSKNFIEITNSSTFGSKMPRVSWEFISNLIVPIPPTKEEQTEIANYLDKKTVEIDQLIAEKKRLVSLYQEEKTAIINQAITKGITSDVKLKDSGIEWLGDIPKHWEVKKMKYECEKIGDGIHTTPKYKNDTKYKFINGNNLDNGSIKYFDTTKSVSESEFLKHKKDIKQGSILISINGTIGKLAFYNNEEVILGKSAAYIQLKDSIYNKFVYFLLQAHYIKTQINLSFSGSTINNLSLYTLNNLAISIPKNKSEQTEIVQHIKKESARIDAKISKAEKYIKLLTEYRTALISEVVTGKIKVID